MDVSTIRAAAPAPEGQAPDPRHRRLGRLGAGGTATVYEELDARLERRVARKVLLAETPAAVAMLKHEYRLLASIAHPNVVHVHELTQDDEGWSMSMELVEGVPIRDWVLAACADEGADDRRVPGTPEPLVSESAVTPSTRSVGRWAGGTGARAPRSAPLSEAALDRLAAAFAQLLCGLSAVHLAGAVHADLKPANVLVTREGRVVLIDFGLSHHARALRRLWVCRGAIAGTPSYLSPEQASGEVPTPRSDFFSIGVMLYELLTGVRPFEQRSASELLHGRFDPPPPAVHLVPGTPAALSDLCDELLQLDPAQRPDPTAVAERLCPGRTACPSFGRALRCPRRRRDAALPRLAAAVAATGPERPSALLIRGAAGVGKSDLLDAYRTAAHGTATVLHARCDPRERIPLQVLDPLVDGLAEALSELAPSTREAILPADPGVLCRRFPVFGAVTGGKAALGPDEPDDDEVLAALRGVLRRLARRGEVMIAIDDVQDCDPSSAAALVRLLAGPDPPRVLVLLALRPAGLPGPACELLEAIAGAVGPARLDTLDLGDSPAPHGPQCPFLAEPRPPAALALLDRIWGIARRALPWRQS